MPEVRLQPAQKKSIAKLLNDVRKDTKLRAELAANPKGVLKEYKLDKLIGKREVHVTLDINAPQKGVKVGQRGMLFAGFHIDANTGHADAEQHQDISTPHADLPTHFDIPHGHADISHEDIPPLHFDI